MEAHRECSEGEDIPSDFFDDFAKDEFIEGLSVIDRWDNEQENTSCVESEKMDSVRDLRQLIARERNDERFSEDADRHRSSSQTHIDDFIKPGSRRDPNKTNRAIKKDKEMKVKEYLAKHLGSSSDLCPPGTELDDFYEENKSMKRKEQPSEERELSPTQEFSDTRSSPRKVRREPKYSPQRKKRSPPPRYRNSPGRYRDLPGRFRTAAGKYRQPPERMRYPSGKFHDSMGKHRELMPRRHESPTRSDRRIMSGTYHRSPPVYRNRSRHHSRSPYDTGYGRERRYSSPRGSPIRTSGRDRSSREPYRRSSSRSPRNKRDDFLYPDNPTPNYVAPNIVFENQPQPEYPGPMSIDYYVKPIGGSVDASVGQVPQLYNLPQVPAYIGFNVPYPYVNQAPQPVPAPIIPTPGNPGLAPALHSSQTLISPHPTNTIASKIGPRNTLKEVSTNPADALAKLVADGILSHEDYLKLAPNKGAIQQMDTSTRVGVLKRCHSAMSKLGDLLPPNRLIVGNIKKHEKLRSIGPKFCSPLKKKLNTEFNFTKISVSDAALQNKHVIDSILSTLELHNVVGRPKKNLPYNVRDVGVQTSNPQCDLCVIRKATLVNEVGTSIDPEHFSSTTHTQVVEEDLQNSRSVFNPTGSSPNGAPISLAHMTPAQLVSQLVARAKTLRQSNSQSSNQYHGRDHYDGRGDSHNYRNNYNNYKY